MSYTRTGSSPVDRIRKGFKLCIYRGLKPFCFSMFYRFLGETGRASLLNIKNCDVELSEGYINLTHTKSKKKQIVPLSSSLCAVLHEYMSIRQGESDDYLFCNSYGGKLGARSADDALTRYCNARGVVSLGHHAFRHTFAKISVRDCNIDVFRLQRLLGHSDIKTTEHYVNLYSADLLKDRDTFNPLEHLLDANQKTEKIRVGKGGKR